jgi:RNA polymerase sigma-70 factor (ECF subfamily)
MTGTRSQLAGLTGFAPSEGRSALSNAVQPHVEFPLLVTGAYEPLLPLKGTIDFHSESSGSPAEPGSRSSFDLDELYRHHRDSIRRYVHRAFGAGPPDPEDVVQIAFEKYAISAQERQIDNPEAFLKASARNYVIDQRRKMAVRMAHVRDASEIGLNERDEFDAARVLEARERWATIEKAIELLDERKREMLIMNRIHGLNCAEIARRKGCSATLVKVEISKALLACERALRKADGA